MHAFKPQTHLIDCKPNDRVNCDATSVILFIPADMCGYMACCLDLKNLPGHRCSVPVLMKVCTADSTAVVGGALSVVKGTHYHKKRLTS